MRILLDTNVLLWWTHAPGRLTPRAISALDEATARYFSVMSLWKIGIKSGRNGFDFPLAKHWEQVIPGHAVRYGFKMVGIRPDHCRRIAMLPKHHGDPFDRMLIAQAQADDLKIVSSDARFDDYGVTRVW